MVTESYAVATLATAAEYAIATGDHEGAIEETESLLAEMEEAGTTAAFESDLDTLIDAVETGPPLSDAAAADARAALRTIQRRSAETFREELRAMEEDLDREPGESSVPIARAFRDRIGESSDE